MKKDWTYKKLGELTKIKTGKLDANASSEDGIYPFFTCSREPLRISSYSYDCECVLVAGNGDLNVKYYNGKFDAYQRTYIIEALPDSGIMTYYMYHFFNQYVETLRQKSIGGIIKYIKLGDLTNALIPIPPLSIQRSIVAELDLLHSLIEKKQEQLRALDNLAQSLFYQMFGDPITNPMGWEIKKLGEVAKFINGDRGINYPSAKDFVNEGVPFINAGHLQQGKVDFSSMNYITDTKFDKLHAGKITKNDILFCLRGSLGKYAIVDFDQKGAIASSLVIIRSEKCVIPLYICNYLKSEVVKEYIEKANNGSSQPNLSANSVSAFSLPLPPLSLQQSFAAKVSAIEEQKRFISQSIKDVESLLAQRMDQYFSSLPVSVLPPVVHDGSK